MLIALGVAPTSLNYRRLEEVASRNDIVLPALQTTGSRGPRPALRQSIIWNKDALEKAIDGSKSVSEVMLKLNIPLSLRARVHEAAKEADQVHASSILAPRAI